MQQTDKNNIYQDAFQHISLVLGGALALYDKEGQRICEKLDEAEVGCLKCAMETIGKALFLAKTRADTMLFHHTVYQRFGSLCRQAAQATGFLRAKPLSGWVAREGCCARRMFRNICSPQVAFPGPPEARPYRNFFISACSCLAILCCTAGLRLDMRCTSSFSFSAAVTSCP